MTDVCSSCLTKVIPMSDGRCPSCLQPFVEASAEQARDAEMLRQQAQYNRTHAPVSDQRRAQAKRDILVGGAFFVGGTVLTVGSYVSASEAGGGGYVVCWGAMFFGLIQLLRGISSGRGI